MIRRSAKEPSCQIKLIPVLHGKCSKIAVDYYLQEHGISEDKIDFD